MEGPLREASLLYQAVTRGIIQATYTNEFPGPAERFDYTLGDLGGVVGPEVDAVVFAWGVGATSSNGRMGLQRLRFLLGAGFSSGVDWLAIAVVARDGQVLWFDRIEALEVDLSDPKSAARFVGTATRFLSAERP